MTPYEGKADMLKNGLVAPPCGSSVRREPQGSGGLIDVLDEKLEKGRVLETAEPPKVVAEADLERKNEM